MAVVAAPLATLLANVIDEKLIGEASLIVVETIQRSLSLLENLINYTKRYVVISSKNGLAKITSKSDLTDAKIESFSPTYIQKGSQRSS